MPEGFWPKVFVAHMVGFFVATFYFEWQYAHEHGFWAWLWFGEIVALFKAFVWELFFIPWLLS